MSKICISMAIGFLIIALAKIVWGEWQWSLWCSGCAIVCSLLAIGAKRQG